MVGISTMQKIKDVKIEPQLDKNVQYVNDLIGIGVSWDIVAKSFSFSNLKMMSYVTNGFFLTMNVVLLLENVEKSISEFVQSRGENHFTMSELAEYLSTHISFVQVQRVPKMSDAIRFILSGPLVTFFDGFDEALMIDTRIYPMRGIEEPEVERVIRGPRDGFTETMLMNTSLIRRRLRDPNLRVELMQIGERSQTDISFLYIEGVADKQLVSNIRDRLKNLKVECLAMGEQALVELIGKVKWNPYPIARYTERPDVASTALTEGQIVIVVDTTPEVVIAPTSLFQHLQHPQEYHSNPIVGTYLRWIIMFAVIASVLLPGVFLVLNANPDVIPHWLAFFKAERGDPLPLGVELLVAEIALAILRLAVVNTPSTLASSVGIVSALLFGQFASQVKLLQPEVLVYMGFVMISERATSSFEIGSANEISRVWIILWTTVLGIVGFGVSTLVWLVVLLSTKSFGVPYLWPLVPFQWKHGLREILIRRPTSDRSGRPAMLKMTKKSS